MGAWTCLEASFFFLFLFFWDMLEASFLQWCKCVRVFSRISIYTCVCVRVVCVSYVCVCVCVFFVCVLYVAAKLPRSTFYEVGQVEGWERMGVLVVCVRSRRERNESARKETRRAGCKGLGGSGGGGHVCV